MQSMQLMQQNNKKSNLYIGRFVDELLEANGGDVPLASFFGFFETVSGDWFSAFLFLTRSTKKNHLSNICSTNQLN